MKKGGRSSHATNRSLSLPIKQSQPIVGAHAEAFEQPNLGDITVQQRPERDEEKVREKREAVGGRG